MISRHNNMHAIEINTESCCSHFFEIKYQD